MHLCQVDVLVLPGARHVALTLGFPLYLLNPPLTSKVHSLILADRPARSFFVHIVNDARFVVIIDAWSHGIVFLDFLESLFFDRVVGRILRARLNQFLNVRSPFPTMLQSYWLPGDCLLWKTAASIKVSRSSFHLYFPGIRFYTELYLTG